MERAWEITKSVGGILLVLELAIWLMGSAHTGRPITNSREFGSAFDQVTGSVAREIGGGLRWIAARGR